MEWAARCELAALYRLIAHFRMTDLIDTHISLRLEDGSGHFLINRYGVLFEHMTASDLVKINSEGQVVDTLFPDHRVNRAGFVIHSAIHMGRGDAHAVLHLHTPHGQAVSAMAEGLLPHTQTAMIAMHDVAYHDFEGIATELDERERLVADLGTKNAMILRNHGTLTVGESVPQAFLRMYYLERACEAQVLMLSAGRAGLYEPNQGIAEKVETQTAAPGMKRLAEGLAWPALLRKLDRIDPSFRD